MHFDPTTEGIAVPRHRQQGCKVTEKVPKIECVRLGPLGIRLIGETRSHHALVWSWTTECPGLDVVKRPSVGRLKL